MSSVVSLAAPFGIAMFYGQGRLILFVARCEGRVSDRGSFLIGAIGVPTPEEDTLIPVTGSVDERECPRSSFGAAYSFHALFSTTEDGFPSRRSHVMLRTTPKSPLTKRNQPHPRPSLGQPR